MPSIPDRIHRALIGHAVDLTRVEGGMRVKIRALLQKLGEDLAKEVLGSGLDTPRTAWQRARLQALVEAADEKITNTYGLISSSLSDQLKGLVQITGEAVITACNDAIGARLLAPVNWTSEQLARIADDTLIRGARSFEWWSRQGRDLSEAFGDEMRVGMLRGESLDQLRDRILGSGISGVGRVGKVDLRKVRDLDRRGLIKAARRNAEALVRTSVIAVSNQAHLDVFSANLDVIGGIQWVSTLDTRTTPVCRALDGLTWSLPSYEPRGHDQAFPGSTAHWCCRSTQIPVTRSWEELARAAGGNTRLARELDKIPVGQRASLGKAVSGDLTYEDWFKSQPAARQKEILGPARLALWHQGQLGFTDMVDQLGNPMTLDQLRARMSA